MYNDFLERIIAGALLLSLILPFFVTQLLAAGSGEKSGRKHINQYRWFILLINLGLNSVVMYAVYARFAGPQKPLEQLATVLGMKCAYQDFWPVAKTSLTGMVFAFAAGFGIKLLLHPLTWGRISAASMGRLIGVVVLWLPVFMLGSSMSLQDAHHLHDLVHRRLTRCQYLAAAFAGSVNHIMVDVHDAHALHQLLPLCAVHLAKRIESHGDAVRNGRFEHRVPVSCVGIHAIASHLHVVFQAQLPMGQQCGHAHRRDGGNRADHGQAAAVAGQLAVQPICQLLRHDLNGDPIRDGMVNAEQYDALIIGNRQARCFGA